MSELIQSKEWVSLDEAVSYLSKRLGEPVLNEDMMKFAMSGNLVISAILPNETLAKKVETEPIEETLEEIELHDFSDLGDILSLHVPYNGKIWKLSDTTSHISGMWDLLIVGGGRIYEMNNNCCEPPRSGCWRDCLEPVFVVSQDGAKHCLVERVFEYGGEEDTYPPICSLPAGADLVVRPQKLLEFVQSLQEKKQDAKGTPLTSNVELPKELQLAISVYYEFWHEKSEETNPATMDSIKLFLSKKIGEAISDESFKRVVTMAKPEKARKGGAPKSGVECYKGKSQEN